MCLAPYQKTPSSFVLRLGWDGAVCQDGRGLNGESNRREVRLTNHPKNGRGRHEDEKDSEMTRILWSELLPGALRRECLDRRTVATQPVRVLGSRIEVRSGLKKFVLTVRRGLARLGEENGQLFIVH
jgi:hypothetical protein